jgi:Fe(3+) dicitrate transport protein
MTNKIYIFFILLLFSGLSNAASVKGKLMNEAELGLAHRILFLSNGQQTETNTQGVFEFTNVLKGEYELKSEVGGQLVMIQLITVATDDQLVDLGNVIMRRNIQLKQAEIRDLSINKGIERMPDVKDNIIYAGKKTEVIKLSAAAANLAQNNSRQIFAKVPGIQVWESDGSGVQMGVASRGLSPNRMWEFNTRQNGYDIAADPFGYPEAYFTPSVESLDRI